MIESFKHAGKTIEIHVDDDPLNPRKEYDNLTTIVHWHRRYDFGRKIEPMSEIEVYEMVAEDGDEVLAILPLYLFDHSGIKINTTGFSCQWDSGQVGWVYVTRSNAEKMGCVGDRYTYEGGKPVKVGTWDEEALKESIRGEVQVYDCYLTGQVYGYIVKGRDGETLEDTWGFIGDLDYVRKEAKETAEACEDPADTEEAEFQASRATYAGVS